MTSCRVRAVAEGHGAAVAAAAAAMASCKDLLLQTPDPTSRKLLPLLLAVSPLCRNEPPLLHAYAAVQALTTDTGVLTWALASESSECREQHLIALGRLAELTAAKDCLV